MSNDTEQLQASQPSSAILTVTPRAGTRFVRVTADGERFVPHRFGDGFFRMADPAQGRVKHHAANQIAVRDDEISAYLERGFLLRMRGQRKGQVNLIAAAEIVRED